MIIALAIFPFLIGGIVMWFVAHMVAPVGYTLSLSRGFVSVVLMACSGTIARLVLRPFIGEWCYLAELGISAAVGMVILQLPFWRSLLAVVAYTIIVVAATIGVGVYATRGQKASNPSVEPMATSQPKPHRGAMGLPQPHMPPRWGLGGLSGGRYYKDVAPLGLGAG